MMKRRLNERDISRIVGRVLNEQVDECVKPNNISIPNECNDPKNINGCLAKLTTLAAQYIFGDQSKYQEIKKYGDCRRSQAGMS